MTNAMKNAVESLTTNGFQVVSTNNKRGFIDAVGNDGEKVTVFIGTTAYCTVVVDGFTCTNMSRPFQVGECARLRRHVAMFENVT